MNVESRAITPDEEKLIIDTLTNGIESLIKPNERVSMILNTIAHTGIMLADCLKLITADIKDIDSEGKFIVVKGQKYPISEAFYGKLMNYCVRNRIGLDEMIFPLKSRNVQDILSKVVNYLKENGTLQEGNISPQSFRKSFTKNNKTKPVAKA